MVGVFKLLFTEEASEDFDNLITDASLLKQLKAVRKALAYLQTNPRHPGLNTHKYQSTRGNNGEEIFESYAENKTPAAYRIFWFYGPKKNQITVSSIIPHP